MAVQGTFSPHIIIHQSAPFRKPVFGLAMLRKSQLPAKKVAKLQMRCSIRDQVFEDHSIGVICYKDDRGEIICEGFDEGPRLQPQHPSTRYPLSDAGMLDLLQQRWLRIMDGQTANGGSLLEEHSCNGFNTLH